jgi:Zn-dependent M28 family amino/carboxypeptidase
MLIVRSQHRKPKRSDAALADVLRCVCPDRLRATVEMLAFPRHYVAEHEANVRARDLLLRQLFGLGYTPVLQGGYHNIVAVSSGPEAGPYLLLGAHYDSVPGSPGADDNGSAVAVCLECARIAREKDIGGVMFVLFNREEDGLLGSRQFVAYQAAKPAWRIAEAHVFEMVGFRSHAPGSQHKPPGLPLLAAPDVGDFLGLLANRSSNAIAEQLLALAATYVPELSVLALKVYLGIEKYVGHLRRSDHAPFWEAGIPAVMWTDTADFRNPHYHQPSDRPETLDYDFLAGVTRLTLARVISRVGQ